MSRAGLTSVRSEGPPPEVLSALFERSIVGMATLDAGGVIVHANAALAILLGVGEGTVTGCALVDFCAADDSSTMQLQLPSALSDAGTSHAGSGSNAESVPVRRSATVTGRGDG